MNTIRIGQKQLLTRPPDECFPSWRRLLRYLEERETGSAEKAVSRDDLTVVRDDDSLALRVGQEHAWYTLNDWSFRQICELSGANPDFISKLRPELAAQVLNETRHKLYGKTDDEAKLLVHENSLVRAIYSPTYCRVPDLLVARLVNTHASGFVPAGDVAGRHVGMPPVRPEASGLYASSRDMFLFLADEVNPVEWRPDQNGGGAAFYRFLIVANSETTARKLCYMMGLMEGICGNHLIWGAQEVVLVERRHVGSADRILDALTQAIDALSDRRTIKQDLRILEAAKTTTFAQDKDKALEILYPRYVTKAIALRALESAVSDFHAAWPISLWNVVRGLTRVSQEIPYEDQRLALDKVAGKLLEAVKP